MSVKTVVLVNCHCDSLCASVCSQVCGCTRTQLSALVKQSVSVLTAMSEASDQSQGILR